MNGSSSLRPAEDWQGIQQKGPRFLSALYAALRALKFYPLENATVESAIDELDRLARGLMDDGEGMELRIVGDFFFLNRVRLRLEITNYATFGLLSRALGVHGIGWIRARPSLDRREWAPLLALLLRNPPRDLAWEAFVERLGEAPVRSIEVGPQALTRDPEVEGEVALEGARLAYALSVRAAQGALADVRLGRAVDANRVKRVVQGIVDQVLANEPSILAMTTLRDFSERLLTHSVNVCIFSVVIGHRMGFDRRVLYELGLCALFHDIGMMRMPPELLDASRVLTPDEEARVRDHPTEGLLELFGAHGFADIPWRPMLVAYEHHMKTDLSGYPVNRRRRAPGLFSRIVAVADGFDRGTEGLDGDSGAPDEVLRQMRDDPALGYDPLIVKVLIGATGVYPVGTLAVLDTFELAIVVRTHSDPGRLHQPSVRLLTDPAGNRLQDAPTVDLSEMDPGGKGPRRSILKTLDPRRYGIRVSDYVT